MKNKKNYTSVATRVSLCVCTRLFVWMCMMCVIGMEFWSCVVRMIRMTPDMYHTSVLDYVVVFSARTRT